ILCGCSPHASAIWGKGNPCYAARSQERRRREMRRETKFVDDDLDEVRARFTKQFEGIQMGQIILVEYGGEYALMRYESHSTEIEKDNVYRLHRGMYVGSISGLLADYEGPPRIRDTDRYK